MQVKHINLRRNLDRRKVIKTMGLGGLALLNPSILFLPKEVWSSENKKLEDYEITFAEAYPVPFYEKDWFAPAVLIATFITTAAVLYFTAGSGAPAAAPGVSKIASLIAGGGPGSYMAGLSIVGSFFGGNAILGGAILNAASLTLFGGTGVSGKASLTLGARIAALYDSILIDVVFINLDKDNKENNNFIFHIPVPSEWGSKRIRENIVEPLEEISEKLSNIQEELMELQREMCEAEKENDVDEKKEIEGKLKKREELKILNEKKLALTKVSNQILQELIDQGKINIDLLVLGIIANNSGNVELFERSLYALDGLRSIGKKISFYNYLKGLSYLYKGDFEKAEIYLYESHREEPYVVEI